MAGQADGAYGIRMLDRRTLLVFLLCFGSYAYFYQGGGPNSFSRFGLAASLAERGRVDIDPYHAWTFDKAFKDSHYYCDKAPGLSLLAAPVHALFRPALARLAEPGSRAWVNLALYVMTLFAVSLPAAVAMAAFYHRTRDEAGLGVALGVTVALALGSPLTVYASLFYSHTLCAALLWLAFLLVTPRADGGGRALSAGLLAGWAVLSEFPAVLIVFLLFLHLFLTTPRRWRAALRFVLGGLPTAGILIVYNLAAFGKPLVSGYQYHFVPEFREQMARGIMGIAGPSLEGFRGTLLLPYRGLLWFWPFFLCVMGAVLMLAARRQLKGRTLTAAIVVVLYLLFGCSYYLWSGGSSYGPRHVIPALPFAAYLVVRAGDSLLRYLVWPAAVVSAALAAVSVATMAEFPELEPDSPPEVANPLVCIAVPRFVHGEMSGKTIGDEGTIAWAPRLPRDDPRYYDAWNLGERLGLNDLASLIPLALFWAACGVALYVTRPPRLAPPRPAPKADAAPAAPPA